MGRLGSWWERQFVEVPPYEPIAHHGFRGDDPEIFSDILDWPENERALYPETNRPRVGIVRSVLAVVATTAGPLLAVACLTVTLSEPRVDEITWWMFTLLGVAVVAVAGALVVSVVRRTRAHLRALAPVRAEADRRYRYKHDWADRQADLGPQRLDILMRLARGDVDRVNAAMQFTGLAPCLAVGAWCIPLFFGPWMIWDLHDQRGTAGLLVTVLVTVLAATFPLGVCALVLAWRRIGLATGLGWKAIRWSRRLDAYAREHHPDASLGGESWQAKWRRNPMMLVAALPPLVLVAALVVRNLG